MTVPAFTTGVTPLLRFPGRLRSPRGTASPGFCNVGLPNQLLFCQIDSSIFLLFSACIRAHLKSEFSTENICCFNLLYV